MADDKTKKKADSGQGGTDSLVNPITPSSGKSGSDASTGGLNLTGGAAGGTGPLDWNAGEVDTAELDSARIPITAEGDDSLGLKQLLPEGGKKGGDVYEEQVASVAKMTEANQQKLAGVLVDAGLLSSKSTPYSPTEVADALGTALKETSQAKSPSLTEYLTGRIAGTGATAGATQKADINDLVSSMQTIADDYQIPGSAGALTSQAQQYLNAGLDTTQAEANFKQAAQAQAAGLYPTFAPQIQAGVTTKTLLDPYAAMAAQVLGYGTTAEGTSGSASAADVSDAEASLGINWASPKWSVALSGGTNPANGGPAPMSLDQWRQTLINNPSYGWQNTDDAKDISSNVSNKLLETFGLIPTGTV